MREIEVGKTYRHFKGMFVKVLMFASDSETLKKVVVYEENGNVWVRDYDMFNSLMDKEKYPDATQEYRFELVD